VWAALLETNYVLSYVACEQRHTWMLHLTTLVALALIGTAAFLAWRAAPPLRAGEQPSSDPASIAVDRARSMAIGGLALCVWFAIVIIATDVPVEVLKVCTPAP
jgi:hypothetical protein